MATTATYTIPADSSHVKYYNSANNTSTSDTIYMGTNRKNRFTITTNNILNTIGDQEITKCVLRLTQGSNYGGGTGTVYIGVSTKSGVANVFPNDYDGAATKWADNTLDSYQATSGNSWATANSVHNFTCTKPIQYALDNYSGTFYIWTYDTNTVGQIGPFQKTYQLIFTLEDSKKIYVYNGGWQAATPYVYNGGWKKATPYYYNGGWTKM